MIDPASFLEEAAGLMEVKGHALFVTLHSGDDDPSIVTESGSLPGFSAAGDTFDLIEVLFQILFDMDFFKHRFMNDFLVAYRKIQKDGEMPVRLVLVLTGAADVDVLISIAPIRGKSFVEPLRAFGDEIEQKVRAFLHHLLGFGPPCIGIRMTEVRGEAGHDRAVFRLHGAPWNNVFLTGRWSPPSGRLQMQQWPSVGAKCICAKIRKERDKYGLFYGRYALWPQSHYKYAEPPI